MSEELYMAVPGMHMHRRERRLLHKLAQEASKHTDSPLILNIGIAGQYGYCSMRCLRAGSSTAMLVGIDIEDQGQMPEDLNRAMTTFLIGDSKELLKKFPFEVDLAFVDGDHTEAGVMADALALFKLVKVGGYIAFHDYGHSGPGFEHVAGVRRAVDKLFNGNDDWEHVTDVVSIRVFRRVLWDAA